MNDDPAGGSGGGDAPDWTTWLRSRLERVARSERRGAEVIDDDDDDSTTDVVGTDVSSTDAPEPETGASVTDVVGADFFDADAFYKSSTDTLDFDADAFYESSSDTLDSDTLDSDTLDSDTEGSVADVHGNDAPEADAPEAEVPTTTPPRPEAPSGFDAQADWLQPSMPPDGGARRTSSLGARAVPPPPGPAAPHVPLSPAPSAQPSDTPPLAAALEQTLGSVMTAVVALSTRIDSLVDATLSARSALNERLGTHADEVRQVARTAVTDLEEYRRSHDRAVTELQRSTTETAETLHRLTERVEHLTTIAGDDEPLVDAVRTVFEANVAEQRSGGQRAEDALAALADRLDRLEGTLGQLVAGLSGLEEKLAVPVDDEPWAEAVRQVFEEVAGARRGDKERTEEALSGIPERLGGVERALSELAEDLAAVRAGPPSPALELDQAQVRAIAVAVAGMLGDRLPAPPAAAYTASDTSPEQQGEPSTPRRRSAPLRATSPRRR